MGIHLGEIGLTNLAGPTGPSGNASTTGSPTAGEVAFFTNATTITGDTNLTWDNVGKILAVITELDIGTTPFVFKESSPRVLQLGTPTLTYDGLTLVVGGASGINSTGAIVAPSIGDSGTTTGVTFGATPGQLELDAGSNFFKLRSDDSFDMEMSSGSGFFGFGGDNAGNAFIDNTDVSVQWSRTANILGFPTFSSPAIVLQAKDGFTNTQRCVQWIGTGTTGEMMFTSPDANSYDLGATGQEWRTGYFGTSVVTPLVDATAGPGLTTKAAAVTAGTGVNTLGTNANDVCGSFTMNGVTDATINFSGTLPATPVVVVSCDSTGNHRKGVTAVSTSAFTVSFDNAFTGTVYYHCLIPN